MWERSEVCSIMDDLVKARTSASHNYVKMGHAVVFTRARHANLMRTVVQCFSVKKVTHGHGLPSARIWDKAIKAARAHINARHQTFAGMLLKKMLNQDQKDACPYILNQLAQNLDGKKLVKMKPMSRASLALTGKKLTLVSFVKVASLSKIQCMEEKVNSTPSVQMWQRLALMVEPLKSLIHVTQQISQRCANMIT